MNAYKGSTKGDKLTKACQKKIKSATSILLKPKANSLRKEKNVEGLTYFSAPKQRYLPHFHKQIQPFIKHYKHSLQTC